jgi:hypothetical protein
MPVEMEDLVVVAIVVEMEDMAAEVVTGWGMEDTAVARVGVG